ncbi:MAG: T9SS type A sorting domain-containing protein, partial [Flavobacteriales bacterium]
AKTVNTNFPIAGAWVDLMDASNSTTYSASTIILQPGQFKIFGNKAATLSNDDITLENNILQLYPNPTSTAFYLSKEALDVKVYDITGKQVKQFTKSVIKNNTFSVTDLNTGIYFVRIKENDNKISTKKLIIN